MTRRAHVIGITGNIATGKSTVVGMLAEYGADTIDADVLVHEMMSRDSPLTRQLVREFGNEIADEEGAVNRPALGQIVFSDSAKLERLEELIHPEVVNRMVEAIHEPGAEVLVLDAIKLFEAGIANHCDEVWVIDASLEIRIDRLMQRNNIDRTEAMRRINAQPPQSEKVARADRVIDNSGTLETTRSQVCAAWETLNSSRIQSS